MKNIVLYGMRGCGKTTVGKKLSEELGYAFYDLDQEIAKIFSLSASEYVQKYGWEKFRLEESIMLKKILNIQENKVFSLGGGTILSAGNQQCVRDTPETFAIFIDASLENIKIRIQKDIEAGKIRNSLTGAGLLDELEKIYIERYPIYEKLSDYRVANNATPETCLSFIISSLS